MLYDHNNQPIEATTDEAKQFDVDVKDIPSQNFPPPTEKPDWFDDAVTKLGGYADPGINKVPKYRVVWGMDPNIKQFAMGKMRMKYVSIVDHIETILGYELVNAKKNKRQFLTPKEAYRRFYDSTTGQLTRGGKPGEVLVPRIRSEEREIGIPLWVVEQWVPPAAFGTAVQWNNERYMINPADPLDYIDALGEYPDKGAYIHWFDLLDYDEEGRTIYRPLDDGAIELIRANHVSNIARRKANQYSTPETARKARDEQWDKQWEDWSDDIRKEMLDVKKNVTTNITPK